jgi:hypothetical protein
MAKTKLVLFIDVDEDLLSKGSSYTELPDQLYTTLYEAFSEGTLEMAGLYLANPTQDAERAVQARALDYHHYAVSVRGEKCTEKNCEQHPGNNILSFHDHSERHRPPPGVN